VVTEQTAVTAETVAAIAEIRGNRDKYITV